MKYCKIFLSPVSKLSKFKYNYALGAQRLQAMGGFQGKFTLNHIVEIIRGSKGKKILQCNWDKDPMYGKYHASSGKIAECMSPLLLYLAPILNFHTS